MNSDRENILGYEVSTLSEKACAAQISDSIESGERGAWLACLNPHSYATAVNKPEFSAAIRNATWLVPDGVGIVMASKILGGKITQRVTGFDVFAALHDELQSRGGASVFLLGSTNETLLEMEARIVSDWPKINIVGTYSPPFKPVFSESEIDEMVARVNDVRPDVLWVGMTAPKQEEWIAQVISRIDVGMAGAIGAVFDFYVGRIKRSHPVLQKLGLEWLPRLLREPRRLWRRTFISAPVFLWHVFKARLQNKSGT